MPLHVASTSRTFPPSAPSISIRHSHCLISPHQSTPIIVIDQHHIVAISWGSLVGITRGDHSWRSLVEIIRAHNARLISS